MTVLNIFYHLIPPCIAAIFNFRFNAGLLGSSTEDLYRARTERPCIVLKNIVEVPQFLRTSKLLIHCGFHVSTNQIVNILAELSGESVAFSQSCYRIVHNFSYVIVIWET